MIKEQIDHYKQEYNDEPVKYCANCLSLKVRYIQAANNMDFCDECGSTNIETCHIVDWEQKYLERYGANYVKI